MSNLCQFVKSVVGKGTENPTEGRHHNPTEGRLGNPTEGRAEKGLKNGIGFCQSENWYMPTDKTDNIKYNYD